MTVKPPPVLLAEDDENDILLMSRAFRDTKVVHPLVALRNGQEVVHYLKGESPYASRVENPWPCLLLLDLKMPLMDGFEVLTWLQRRRRPRPLRVVILTSSTIQTDLSRALELGADAYWVKPRNYYQLLDMVRDLREKILEPPPVIPSLPLRNREELR